MAEEYYVYSREDLDDPIGPFPTLEAAAAKAESSLPPGLAVLAVRRDVPRLPDGAFDAQLLVDNLRDHYLDEAMGEEAVDRWCASLDQAALDELSAAMRKTAETFLSEHGEWPPPFFDLEDVREIRVGPRKAAEPWKV